jgi:hypothetical protein
MLDRTTTRSQYYPQVLACLRWQSVFSDLRPVILRLPFFEFYRLLRTFRLHFQSCPVFLPFPEFLLAFPASRPKNVELPLLVFGFSAKNAKLPLLVSASRPKTSFWTLAPDSFESEPAKLDYPKVLPQNQSIYLNIS